MSTVSERLVAQSVGLGADLGGLGSRCPAAVPPSRLRWARFLAETDAEGPGRRSALWVQGCGVRCPGCFNPHLWADRGARTGVAEELAADWVSRALGAGACGVTLLGGEPFDQAAPLVTVARAFHDAGLSVMTFTGYTLGALERWSEHRADIAELLAETDLLCDGPYLRDLPDDARPWIGSRNQSIRALSEVHAADVARIGVPSAESGVAGSAPHPDRLEIRLGTDGSVAVNGWATDAALAALFDDLGVRADRPFADREELAR